MSLPFSRSMRSLDTDGFGRSIAGVSLLIALLVAWGAWSVFAKVPIYEVTDEARLEADQATHSVQARVAGRVLATRLAIGRAVRAGDLLVELEAAEEQLALNEERARMAALEAEHTGVGRERAAENRALIVERQASRAAVEQARAQSTQAEAAAGFAETERERVARLRAEGLVNELEFLRVTAEARKMRAAAESFARAVTRLEEEQRSRESDRMVRIERLQSEEARLNGRLATARETLKRLEYEIDLRRIRAPVAGQLAEAADLRVGGVIGEGFKVGAIVPLGPLRAVAEFPPGDALGRVRPGQSARLRLVGFPWAQYGHIPARVTSVASEIRSGRVRVELALLSASTSAIPLQHGLPGSAEVEVERVRPATLVLRAAGRLVSKSVIRSSSTRGPQT